MRILDNPWLIAILILAALLLFGAPKLPGMARSLGQSMRIFKSEVKQMKDDGSATDHPADPGYRQTTTSAAADPLPPTAVSPTPPTTGLPSRDQHDPATGTGGAGSH